MFKGGGKIMRYILCLFFTFFYLSSFALAAGAGFTQKDRELLIRLEERLNQIDKMFEQMDKRFEQVELRISELREDTNKRFAELREDMNKRFEQVDKRFEQVDKRFEQVDKRFEQVDKRFEQVDKRFEEVNRRFESMLQLMMAIVGAFAAIVAVSIGFAIWDRRTMIRPFETKVKEIEENILEDRNRLKKLIEALRQLAREDTKLATVLRSFALL